MRAGDWRPCQFLDPKLTAAAEHLEETDGLVPLATRYQLGPAGRRIHDAFEPIPETGDNDPSLRVYWSRSSRLHIHLTAEPERRVQPKATKVDLAGRYLNQAGHLLLAGQFDTLSGRLLALYSKQPSVGVMWVPIQQEFADHTEARALCAWFNSTAGALGLLYRRAAKLTNPAFKLALLRSLPVPDFRRLDPAPLVEAFNAMQEAKVLPWKEAAQDPVRICLDRAVARTLGMKEVELEDWRRCLAVEPTIQGRTKVKS